MNIAIAIVITGVLVAVIVRTVRENELEDLRETLNQNTTTLDQIGVKMGENQTKVDEFVAQVDKIHTEITGELGALREEVEAVKAQLEDSDVDFTALEEKLDALDALVDDVVVEPPVEEEPPAEEPPAEEPPVEEPPVEEPPVEEMPTEGDEDEGEQIDPLGLT